MRIFRKNSFMLPAKMEIAGKESYIYRIPVQSALIGIWRDKIVNWVTIPPHFSPKTRGVIDVYDLDGRLLTSLEITDRIFPTPLISAPP